MHQNSVLNYITSNQNIQINLSLIIVKDKYRVEKLLENLARIYKKIYYSIERQSNESTNLDDKFEDALIELELIEQEIIHKRKNSDDLNFFIGLIDVVIILLDINKGNNVTRQKLLAVGRRLFDSCYPSDLFNYKEIMYEINFYYWLERYGLLSKTWFNDYENIQRRKMNKELIPTSDELEKFYEENREAMYYDMIYKLGKCDKFPINLLLEYEIQCYLEKIKKLNDLQFKIYHEKNLRF